MRIIAGTLKGRRLQGPRPGDLGIRPTSDMAREALFSVLQRWPRGAFLDLFGGTGAVALEAWSRGYGPVDCVEMSPEALALAGANARGTDLRLHRKDVLRLRDDAYRDLAVIFCDPPYACSAVLWEQLSPRLRSWIAPEGILVWESDAREPLAAAPGWRLLEERRYGAACFHLLEPE